MGSARITNDRALALAREHFGLDGTVSGLPSYIDQNFLLVHGAEKFVLKFASPESPLEDIELENGIMRRIAAVAPSAPCPRVRRSVAGTELVFVDGRTMRVITGLSGRHLADCRPLRPALLRDLGTVLAEVDDALAGFAHPGMHRELRWDLARASWIVPGVAAIADPVLRRAVRHATIQFQAHVEPRMRELRQSVIHNDANDYNVLVEGEVVTGLIDFGDAVASCRVFNLAIAAAYAVLDSEQPLRDMCALVAAYHATAPLTEPELAVLFPSICMRYCVSVVAAEEELRRHPENDYVAVSQAPVRRALQDFVGWSAREVENAVREACGWRALPGTGRAPESLRAARDQRLGRALSLSYSEPLKIVRGQMQYLFDDQGRAYVDGVNNVCHVGHCHPEVVAAAQAQIATLNTNTRYLHDYVVEYAERLTALFPDPLDTCFLVCSGSEANELALRLARGHTGRHDVVVLDHAYHGNTSSLVELSPYKHDGPGGGGRPEHVHVVPLADGFRGPHRFGEPELGPRYAEHVAEAMAAAEARGGAAAFFAESISGCGGQVEFPPGYLSAAFAHARAAGAVCVSDEVQVGFGRVGSHMWAFETQGVVPDIVTLGKPIGNGHPLAAVVTRADIAASFDNGMEYFNTFGGNPVSSAIGLAVLDAIEADGLRAHAAEVGAVLLAGFRDLAAEFPIMADVRGRGLFLGVEFVRDLATREPAVEELARVVERMKGEGFLLSIDGPLHNVLKFKPPMPFSRNDATLLLSALRDALAADY